MREENLQYELRIHREHAGMTQQEISRRLNITRQAYCNYENHLREPNLSTLVKISRILHVSLDALVKNAAAQIEKEITMEIERKYLIKELPENLDSYPKHRIEQGYLCTEPVIRIRRQDDSYYLTYKSKGLMVREEYNLPLTADSYLHLKQKIDGILISKTRYLLPLDDDLTIELDVFDSPYEGLYLAEVEFPSVEAANAFLPPDWFGEDVTGSGTYHNSTLSKR